MANRVRGEAELTAGGRSYRMLLTLGALAEIEDGLGLADLSQVSKRLAQARAADLAVVAAALLRGGGHAITPAEVLRLPCDLGALVAAIAASFEAAGMPRRAEAAADAPQRPFAGAPCSSSG
jgi:hypothetical protein